jgi:hypothetical protein
MDKTAQTELVQALRDQHRNVRGLLWTCPTTNQNYLIQYATCSAGELFRASRPEHGGFASTQPSWTVSEDQLVRGRLQLVL